MARLEQTLDGKELPKNVALYRDENTGALEVRFWRLYPMLLFMIPFMCVWTYFSVGKMYVEPFLTGQPIRDALFGIPFVLGALFFCNRSGCRYDLIHQIKRHINPKAVLHFVYRPTKALRRRLLGISRIRLL